MFRKSYKKRIPLNSLWQKYVHNPPFQLSKEKKTFLHMFHSHLYKWICFLILMKWLTIYKSTTFSKCFVSLILHCFLSLTSANSQRRVTIGILLLPILAKFYIYLFHVRKNTAGLSNDSELYLPYTLVIWGKCLPLTRRYGATGFSWIKPILR